MALKLKTWKTYTDEFWTIRNELYCVIDKVTIDKKEKTCHFCVDFYVNKTSRDEQKKAIEQKRLSVIPTEEENPNEMFDKYFSTQAIDEDHNHFHRSYAFCLEQLTDFSDFEWDE